MSSGELIILDVGHGNCTIIRHGTEAIIIDAPGRPIVAKTLDELGIKSITAVLISHADSDHLSGAIAIMSSDIRPVAHVYVNPDNRTSESWRLFRVAAGLARKKSGTAVHTSLNVVDPGEVSLQGTKLQVLFPTPELCLATNGGLDTDGRRIDANSMSAVVLVEHDGERVCLLAADSGYHGLESMMDEKIDMRAQMLVFPHHGGNVAGAGNNKTFATQLVENVEPTVVIFSVGRGAHGTPRPEIIAGVREAMSGEPPYIACTQLSKNCIDALPTAKRKLNPQSDGFTKNSCCAGTITWPLKKNGIISVTNELTDNHTNFVLKDVPLGLCHKGAAPISITMIPRVASQPVIALTQMTSAP